MTSDSEKQKMENLNKKILWQWYRKEYSKINITSVEALNGWEFDFTLYMFFFDK
jgi:hypothetical protein